MKYFVFSDKPEPPSKWRSADSKISPSAKIRKLNAQETVDALKEQVEEYRNIIIDHMGTIQDLKDENKKLKEEVRILR